MVDVAGTQLDTIVDANPGHRFDFEFHANLSPDGARILYSSCEFPTGDIDMSMPDARSERQKFHYEIATVTLDGSASERLTENDYIDHYPVWSPDTTHIAFMAGQLSWVEPQRLRVMRVSDSHQRDLLVATDPTLRLTYPARLAPLWSPDSKLIAFFLKDSGDGGDWHYRIPSISTLYTVRLDGSGLSRISELTGAASWSPDGQRLAVTRVEGEDVVLSTIAPDGSRPHNLIKITDRETSFTDETIVGRFGWGPPGPVSWSPDGAHILYVCEVGVCVVDLDGNLVGLTLAELIPDKGRPYAAWSSDGSRIAVRTPGLPFYGDHPYPAISPHADGSTAVFTMAFDGTDVQVLVRGGPPGGPLLVAENAGEE